MVSKKIAGDKNPIEFIQHENGDVFSSRHIFSEPNPRNEVESILEIKNNLITHSFEKLLEYSIGMLKLKLDHIKRRKKFTTKPRFINELQDVESSKKEVGNIGVIAPFLEERQIETGSNYKIRKLTTTVQEIVIKKITEQIELPPEPVVINIFIPNSLLKAFEGASNLEDYYSTIKYIFLVIDEIQNILNIDVEIKLTIIGGTTVDTGILLENMGIDKLKSSLEVKVQDNINYLNGIIIDIIGIKNYLPIKSNDLFGYDSLQSYKDTSLNISESISRIEKKLIDMILKILDNYFE